MNDEGFYNFVDLILTAIERLPDPPREKIKEIFMKIKDMLLENRPPRIMIIGRRGAGKSSLINAIFQDKVAEVGPVLSQTGEAEWHTYKNNKGAIHILDTRGIGDLTKPEAANFKDSLDDIQNQILKKCPDAILFLCKAKEVDAHVSEDVKCVVAIRSFVSQKLDYKLPVAAVVTQVDELNPKLIIDPPYDNEDKRQNISIAVDALNKALLSSGIESLKTIPVSAYADYTDGILTYDNFWNIDILVEYLMEVLPNTAQLQLARLSQIKKAQEKCARVLIGSIATVCGGIAAVPIPVADIIPITSAQIVMITGIAYIAGLELSRESAIKFLGALGIHVGTGFFFREAARALIKFVFPGAGNMISAAVASAGTWAIGEAAIAYFIQKVAVEEAEKRFNETMKNSEDQ